jgi:hypothetical protein
MRDNTTTSWGVQKQNMTRGGGRGEDKLGDVRQSCHERQHGNQLGQTRGKWEVELPAQCEAAVHQEVAVLMRGREVEAAQRYATQQSAGANEGGGSRMDT